MNIKKLVFVSASCLCLVFAVSSQARSEMGTQILDTQEVIVELDDVNSASGSMQRIGQTNYYTTTMAVARELSLSGHAKMISVPETYDSLLVANDPLEPQGYLTLIDAESLWDETTGDNSVVVAVIDSGFALAHEDLSGRWYENPGEAGALASNGVDDDGNGFIDDWRGWDFAYDDNDPSAGSVDTAGAAVGHGTAVSGMIGATGNNATGVASLNWNVGLLPLQIFQDNGTASTAELAAAMDYAVNNGADIINLSLGSTSSDPVIESILADTEAAGITVVASAGNCGDTDYASEGCSYQGQTLFPATDPRTVAIGATTLTDSRASFSSYGSIVDLTAPGSGSIRTTLYDSGDPTGAYSGSIYGTSFSAPLVSGLVATVKSEWPAGDTHDIRSAIVDTVYKPSGMSGQLYTNYYGFGRVEPLAAVERARACAAVALSEDINCDGGVGLLDLSSLVSQWQVDRTGRTDINSSGQTEILDLSSLVSKWGL